MNLINDGMNSKGYALYKELYHPRTLYSTYLLNHNQLFKRIENYYSSIDYLDDTIVRRFRQKVLVKDIFNVLTSARTYVEILIEDHLEDESFCFMKELRNYISHVKSFPLSSRFNANPIDRVKRYESLKVDDIEQYLENQIERHPKRVGIKNAKKFLGENKDLNLNTLLRDYFKKISNHFETYLLTQVQENFSSFEDLILKGSIIQEEMKELGISKPDLLSKPEIRHLKWLLAKYNN